MSERPQLRLFVLHRITSSLGWALLAACMSWGLFAAADDALAKSKLKPVPRPEPDLKIVELKVTPNPFVPTQQGQLEFAITLQLPKDLDGATMLEVSSLVSLPSKTSIAFLSMRQPVHAHRNNGKSASSATGGTESSNDPEDRPRVSLVLTWDGNDQHERVAPAGAYGYEVRAKLLAVGEKGARTQMTSWPKRGTLVVK